MAILTIIDGVAYWAEDHGDSRPASGLLHEISLSGNSGEDMPQMFILRKRPHPHTSESMLQFDPSHLIPEAQLLVLLARTSVNGSLQVEIHDRLRDGVDWAFLWQLALAHGVAPLVYRTLLTHGGGSVPNDTLAAFRRHAQATAIVSNLLAEELGTLIETFLAKGVRVIPVKGPMLASVAYGDVALRECADLDLIVEQSAIPRARQLLWSHGYQLAGNDTAGGNVSEEVSHTFVKKNGMFHLELQWAMVRRLFLFRLDREEFWNQLKPVRLGQKTVMALAPEELLVVLCVHGTKHAWQDLKCICDVSELLQRRRTLDWSRVSFLSRTLGCRRMLFMGLALAHTLFDAPLPRALRHAIMTDRDIPHLTKAMPGGLLKAGTEGINEKDAEALYLLLKDSWIEQSKYAVAVCHAALPIVDKPLSWFRLQSRLNILYRVFHPLHRAAAWGLPFLRFRKLILKWLEAPG